MGKKYNDTSSGLAETTAVLVSAILLGSILAVGYMLNVQTALAAGEDQGGKGSGDSGDNKGEGIAGQIQKAIGGGNDDEKDRGQDNEGDNGGGGDSGDGQRGDRGHGGEGDNGGGGGNEQDQQYCYSASVTNPLNGKTRTVNVCFDSRSDCDQAESSDPDSASGCDTR